MQTSKRVMSQDEAEHFYRWLEKTVHISEQHTVEEQIHALLREHPNLIATHSWPEMRNLSQHINVWEN